jgi:polysaccharide export outer membrane protein
VGLKLPFPLIVFLLAVVSVPGLLNSAEDSSSYVLRKLDVVSIQVFGEPDLNKVQRIDGSGNIRMGLIGTVKIVGLTLREAESVLQQEYVSQRFLRDPQVSLQVDEYAAQYVSVLGQVEKPGRVQMEDESTGMRLVDAISAVGGFTGIAKGDAVRITRVNEDNTETTITVDAEALINGREASIPQTFLNLQPGDIVFVPERLF